MRSAPHRVADVEVNAMARRRDRTGSDVAVSLGSLAAAVGKGLAAGLAGTGAMTVSRTDKSYGCVGPQLSGVPGTAMRSTGPCRGGIPVWDSTTRPRRGHG